MRATRVRAPWLTSERDRRRRAARPRGVRGLSTATDTASDGGALFALRGCRRGDEAQDKSKGSSLGQFMGKGGRGMTNTVETVGKATAISILVAAGILAVWVIIVVWTK